MDIIIAIDGFSSTGKSTVARRLANSLGYTYVDTGAMYRAVTLYAIKKGFIHDDHFDVTEMLKNLDDIEIRFINNEKLKKSEVYLNGENVENEIRSMEVSDFVSKVATVSEIRRIMVAQQQEMGKNKGIVMDGRDIGSVVFPEAELKIFMTASPEKRAMRRFMELKDRGDEVTLDDVLENVRKRDYIDTHRQDSPLVTSKDAVVLDNTNLDLDEQFNIVKAWADERIAKASKK
ncbi:(d)CMP kinase [Aegicerativicinus sediminis]|uniref:(d)CMP kinase n=1 Tax=Aegicerativicinus sediminis TaxID=2893202 RepID=UPI00374247BB